MTRYIAILLILLLGSGTSSLLFNPAHLAAFAQTSTEVPDYVLWGKVAARSEVATENGRASNTALEGLRSELVDWRSQFTAARDVNKARISTHRNQINSLGPPPEGSSVEPAELTIRRAELTAQLGELEAPQLRAVEAFSRANGLIQEIDNLIRNRQAAQLFELNPSPANPTIWPDAWRTLGASIAGARSEIQTAWGSEALQKRLKNNLAKTLIFLIVAAVLLLRGRSWMVSLTAIVQRTASGAQARMRGFVASIGQVVLPLLGIFAFAQALFSTDMLGLRGQLIVDGSVNIGIAFYVGRWLSLRLLPRQPSAAMLFQIPDGTANTLRNLATALAVLLGVDQLLSRLEVFESYAVTTGVVLHSPIILISGFLLFRFGRIVLANLAIFESDVDGQQSIRSRGVEVLGWALVAVGIAGPIVAAIGYNTAASAVIFPTILTIGLLAAMLVLSALARDIYAVMTGSDDETARAALIPVLVGFAIIVGSIPLFALIWGARTADLTEMWTRFLAGFQFGETQISPTSFLTFALIFTVGYVLTRAFQSTLRTTVLPKTNIETGGQTAIVSGLGYVGFFSAAVIAITMAGIDLSSLAIVAGALSVGIGFGLQNIVSNFVSGVILLIERPIAEGDWIDVAGYSGTVREISVRSTRIETFDRTDVIIPNSDLVSGAVTNYTRGNLIGRAVISVGVAYGTDTVKVQGILEDIAKAHPMVSLNPSPSVHLVGFGADSLDFQIRAVLRDVNFILTVKSEIHHEIVRRFAQENIEIPFAQRDLWLRNPEVLGTTKKNLPKPKAK